MERMALRSMGLGGWGAGMAVPFADVAEPVVVGFGEVVLEDLIGWLVPACVAIPGGIVVRDEEEVMDHHDGATFSPSDKDAADLTWEVLAGVS